MNNFIYCVFLGNLMINGLIGKPTGDGKQAEPNANPLESLHGVLMHGDSDIGDSHKAEDNYIKFKPVLETGQKEAQGPKDAEETFHASLMHGSKDFHHDKIEMEQPQKPPESFGPKDTNEYMHDVMHGETDKAHDHSKDKIEVTIEIQSGPPDAERMMHDVLMHGGTNVENHHVHSRPEDADPKASGPLDQNTLMHDLMHGGNSVEHAEHTDQNVAPSGPNTDQLHGVLMHHDSDIGKNHDEEHDHSKNKPFKFNIEEIKKLGIDPDILKTVLKEDSEDFKQWKLEQSKNGDDFLHYTQGSISDSMLSDIERMKQRYLAKNPKVEQEIDEYAKSRDSDLNADEMSTMMDLDSMHHENEDMRHDLELIGSTQPINQHYGSHDEQ